MVLVAYSAKYLRYCVLNRHNECSYSIFFFSLRLCVYLPMNSFSNDSISHKVNFIIYDVLACCLAKVADFSPDGRYQTVFDIEHCMNQQIGFDCRQNDEKIDFPAHALIAQSFPKYHKSIFETLSMVVCFHQCSKSVICKPWVECIQIGLQQVQIGFELQRVDNLKRLLQNKLA